MDRHRDYKAVRGHYLTLCRKGLPTSLLESGGWGQGAEGWQGQAALRTWVELNLKDDKGQPNGGLEEKHSKQKGSKHRDLDMGTDRAGKLIHSTKHF